MSAVHRFECFFQLKPWLLRVVGANGLGRLAAVGSGILAPREDETPSPGRPELPAKTFVDVHPASPLSS